VGVAVLVFALLFAIYALGVYHYRRTAIVSRNVDGHYDDKWGPTVLVVGLFFYLFSMLVLELSVPPVMVVPMVAPPVTRDYRLPFKTVFLTAGAITSNLFTLRSDIANKLPSWSFSGALDPLTSNATIAYYDTRNSCALRMKGYNMRSIQVSNAAVVTTNTAFQYRSNDGQVMARLDAAYPSANYYAADFILPPLNFQYVREKTYPLDPSIVFPRLQSVLSYITQFFLSNNIDPLNLGELVEQVNSVSLQQCVYGGVNVVVGNANRPATISAYVWYNSGTPIYGELSISFKTLSGEDMARTEVRDLTAIYQQLQTVIPQLSTVSNDITNVVYNLQPFCT